MMQRVLGVDGYARGWVGIALDQGGGTSAYVASSIAALAAKAEATGEVAVVGIDIPIGLPDEGRRRADVLAREMVGPRRSSVFMTPVRPALRADDHATAVRVNRRLAGEGVSVQAFGLRARIFEAEAWAREGARRVVEVHPEVSFARMAGAALPEGKNTWAGAERRRALLGEAGIRLAGDLGEAGRVARVDDVLDATVVAWSARRVARGEAVSLPDPPEVFSDGWPCAIWV